jgi:RNA-binding protein 5/10
MVVVYPLPLTFDEQEFAKEMQRLELEKSNAAQETGEDAPKLKSTAHVGGLAVGMGARSGSLHRIFLMRDVSTEHFYGYGFAEFWTREDATQALTRVRNSPAFTMGTSKVFVANIHMGVFLPEDREVVEEIEHESFFPLLNPQLRVRYRDPRVYPSQLVVNAESPDAVQNAKADDAAAADKKKGKKRKAEGVAGAAGGKKAVPMAGQMALWQKKHDEIHSAASNKAQDASLSAANQTPLGGSSTSTVKPMANAPIKISLSGATKFGESSNSGQSTPQRSEIGDVVAPQQPSSSGPSIPSYVDFSNLHCYLCRMKYKSAEDLAKHEKSRNHKEASTDNAKVEGAKRKIEARGSLFQGTPQEAPEPEGNAGAQYRDRAKERRQMFGRPAKQTSSSTKNDTAEEASKAAAAAASPAKPAAQSKGMSMLLKQGWTGEGLGANGEGRTEALVTNAYQERAGLGVEGGLLGDAAELAAKKTTNDRGEYAKTARDKARDRLSKME